uniref:Small RNA binding exonuclease protection factor La n=1 Tax=Sphaeramia orbicularis TaxID=375764 RepID=A0A672YKJ5_9TELE
MAENQEMSSVEMKVARQIEYYFGDHNLPRDKFLKEQLQLDDGWVPLETMLKFNRLKSLTTDSTGLLEISEDKTKIRRAPNKPLPELNDEYKDNYYLKGFPLETSLDEIQDWLNGKGNIENIQMRRNLQRQFKGSIFICFDTEESSKQFLERSDIKSYKDNEMLVLSREAYHAKKAEERKQVKAETKAKAKHDKEEQQKQGLLLDEQTGCLLKFSGELEDVSREDFHELFKGHGRIKWVHFTSGAKEVGTPSGTGLSLEFRVKVYDLLKLPYTPNQGSLLFDGNAKEAFE